MNPLYLEQVEQSLSKAISINTFYTCLIKLCQVSKLDICMFTSPKSHQKEWRQTLQIISEYMAFKAEYMPHHLKAVSALEEALQE